MEYTYMSNSIINLDQLDAGFTMSSLDFLNGIINPAREEAGEKSISNKDFTNRVADELNLKEENFLLFDSGNAGRKAKYINLNADQLLLVGMRESKAVRLKVLEYIRKVEAKAKQLEDQQKRAAVQSANRRGVTWGDYCKVHGLPAQKLISILKQECKLFQVNPVSGEWSVNPAFAEYFRVIKSKDQKFNPNGINVRFNAKGLAHFSQPEHVLKMRGKVIAVHGTDADKQRHLQDIAKLQGKGEDDQS